ncbi:MAG: AbrB/MazE/SpoVT family DNA-binding domain-containing protein [Desulfobulbaceae bacterium]|nr:AbrB/MazE/SpoVT family DNA-binding domain-containing protein [Desulfobulbaceae bacterium]
MAGVATTKLSSKGQVVIPESIRNKLHLKTGAQFVVLGDKDIVILKNISPPTIEEFDGLIAKARKSAKNVGLKKNDIANAIAKVRAKK